MVLLARLQVLEASATKATVWEWMDSVELPSSPIRVDWWLVVLLLMLLEHVVMSVVSSSAPTKIGLVIASRTLALLDQRALLQVRPSQEVPQDRFATASLCQISLHRPLFAMARLVPRVPSLVVFA